MHYIDHKPDTTYFYLPLCSVLDSDQLSSESKPDRIPLVCRQVHTEVALLPYVLGTFDFFSAAGEGFQGLWALKRYLEGWSSRQIDVTVHLKFRQNSFALEEIWVRTRTAAYWVAKLEELSISAGNMTPTERRHFDVSSMGPSDT